MNWQFWKPKHTVESVAKRLASGLRDGSIILDVPLADEPFEDDIGIDAEVVQIDLPERTADVLAGGQTQSRTTRLRRRADLEFAPLNDAGRTYFVVKDSVSQRCFRFKEQEHFLLAQMDGEKSLDALQKAFEDRFRPERLRFEDLEQFVRQLLATGLVQIEATRVVQQFSDSGNH